MNKQKINKNNKRRNLNEEGYARRPGLCRPLNPQKMFLWRREREDRVLGRGQDALLLRYEPRYNVFLKQLITSIVPL